MSKANDISDKFKISNETSVKSKSKQINIPKILNFNLSESHRLETTFRSDCQLQLVYRLHLSSHVLYG